MPGRAVVEWPGQRRWRQTDWGQWRAPSGGPTLQGGRGIYEGVPRTGALHSSAGGLVLILAAREIMSVEIIAI